mgnify:CR=1 FL=1
MPRLHMGDVYEHIFAPLIHDYLPVTFTQQLSYLDEKGTTPKCYMITYNMITCNIYTAVVLP